MNSNIFDTSNIFYSDKFMYQIIQKQVYITISTFTFFIFFFFCIIINRRNKKSYLFLIQEQKQINISIKKKILLPILIKIIYILCFLTYSTFILSLIGIIITIYSFGKLGNKNYQKLLLQVIIFSLGIFSIILYLYFLQSSLHKIKVILLNLFYINRQFTKIIFLISIIFLWALVCFLLTLFTKNICICNYTTRYGFQGQNQSVYSTQFTRSRQLINKICPDNQICHFYATLTENTDTQVFFNIQTGMNIEKVIIQFQQIEKYQRNNLFNFSAQANLISVIDDVQQIGNRNVFTALIKQLKPSVLYVVKISAHNQTFITNYKTLPHQNNTQNLIIAFGGDVGLNDNGQMLINQLIQIKPDVIFIGGDITYDNGMRTCYYSWDIFFDMFNYVNMKINRTVPMIFSVGNHDVGFNIYASVSSTIEVKDVRPYYFEFLPQHYGIQNGIPKVQERSSIHFHKIGNTLHFFLDSGYMKKYQQQINFINQISNQNTQYRKFANYHNPIYPSCFQNETLSWNQISQGQKYWVPLFQKHQFLVSMEHHEHQLKKSYPIISRKVNQSGVIYLGDGFWGVSQPKCSEQNQMQSYFGQIFENKSNDQHFWVAYINQKNITFKAYGLKDIIVQFNIMK